jgi:tagatose 6-phosphate kinase
LILSITLNLAVDKVATAERLECGRENRIEVKTRLPGGKGVNVARALNCAGMEVSVSGFAGGKNGEYIQEGLLAEGINPFLFPIEEESRVCLILVEKDGRVTEIYEKGPLIPENAQVGFLNYIKEVGRGFSWVSISGSLPPGFAADYYSKLLRKLKGKIFLDFHGSAMLSALKKGAFLLKVNQREFTRTFQVEEGKIPSVMCRLLEKFPLKYLVVTLGGKGTLGAEKGKVYRAGVTFQPNVVCPVGAGDAFMAGLIYSFFKGEDFKQALKRGVSFSVSNLGFWEGGRVDLQYAERILKKVKLEET